MTRTATLITAIVVVFILAGGFWLFMQPIAVPPSTDDNQTNAEADVRAVVTNFGDRLKNVSLLSTSTVVADLGTQYGPYFSSDLLARWEANPTLALGRLTSSPWPDRIEITSVERTGDNEYTVRGDVVEVTNANTASTTPNSYPITLTLVNVSGAWVITSVTKDS